MSVKRKGDSRGGAESEPLTAQQLSIRKRLNKLKQRLLDHHLTKEEVDMLCDLFDNVKLGRLTPQESERRGGGTFRVSSTGEHAWEINFPLPDHVENILCWIDQAKECSRQLNQKQPKTEKHQYGVVYQAIVDSTIVDKVHLLEVIPPTVKSAHLKAFVVEAYTKLKCAIMAHFSLVYASTINLMKNTSSYKKLDEKYKQLQEMEKSCWWWLRNVRDDDSQQKMKHLRAICDDLQSELQSLYQWVCKEDREISQELAPVDLLLQLLEWLSRITSYLIEDARRGGFRNLLLDGWWLEFWEIILLAAGDVERNPGPRQITDTQLAMVDNRILGKQDLFQVRDAVFDCRKCWFDLCLALQLSCDHLSAIAKEHGGDTSACLREGLTLWLHGDYDTARHGPPTWRKLVDAVANSSGGNDLTLALEIAQNHNMHEAAQANSVHDRDRTSESKKSKEMSSVFSKLYRSIIGHMRRVDVDEIKDVLYYLSNPRSPSERCVPPGVYQSATSTKDLLDRLYPEYINPESTFPLEEIVDSCGSRQCKKILREYTSKYLQ